MKLLSTAILSPGKGGRMSVFLIMSLCLVSADFPICTNSSSQYYPCAIFENDQYYVFWSDRRHYSPYYSVYGARIEMDGTVLDPDGKCLYKWQAGYELDAAYDGVGFLLAFRDSC